MKIIEVIELLKTFPQEAEFRFWNFQELREETPEKDNFSLTHPLVVLVE